jgi:hypothetical protein
METNIPFIPDDNPNRNKLQLTMFDLEQHKEWKASKTGGVDPRDVIFVMGDNNISHFILPTLRRHKLAVIAIVWIAYSLYWIYFWYGRFIF